MDDVKEEEEEKRERDLCSSHMVKCFCFQVEGMELKQQQLLLDDDVWRNCTH